MQVIYVLHFDTPIHHASHYVGSTSNLAKRLRRHASGHGARLLAVLRERGIEWRLGGVMITDYPSPDIASESRLTKERRLKLQKHASRYCQICSRDADRLYGSLPMDISLMPAPTDSKSLRETKG